MSIVNNPEVSGPLEWFYVVTATLLAILGLFFVYLYLQAPMLAGIVCLIVIVAVDIITISIWFPYTLHATF